MSHIEYLLGQRKKKRFVSASLVPKPYNTLLFRFCFLFVCLFAVVFFSPKRLYTMQKFFFYCIFRLPFFCCFVANFLFFSWWLKKKAEKNSQNLKKKGKKMKCDIFRYKGLHSDCLFNRTCNFNSLTRKYGFFFHIRYWSQLHKMVSTVEFGTIHHLL